MYNAPRRTRYTTQNYGQNTQEEMRQVFGESEVVLKAPGFETRVFVESSFGGELEARETYQARPSHPTMNRVSDAHKRRSGADYHYEEYIDRLKKENNRLHGIEDQLRAVSSEKFYLQSQIEELRARKLQQSEEFVAETMKDLKAKLFRLKIERDDLETELEAHSQTIAYLRHQLQKSRNLKDGEAQKVTSQLNALKERYSQVINENSSLGANSRGSFGQPDLTTLLEAKDCTIEALENKVRTLGEQLEQPQSCNNCLNREHRISQAVQPARPSNYLAQQASRDSTRPNTSYNSETLPEEAPGNPRASIFGYAGKQAAEENSPQRSPRYSARLSRPIIEENSPRYSTRPSRPSVFQNHPRVSERMSVRPSMREGIRPSVFAPSSSNSRPSYTEAYSRESIPSSSFLPKERTSRRSTYVNPSAEIRPSYFVPTSEARNSVSRVVADRRKTIINDPIYSRRSDSPNLRLSSPKNCCSTIIDVSCTSCPCCGRLLDVSVDSHIQEQHDYIHTPRRYSGSQDGTYVIRREYPTCLS